MDQQAAPPQPAAPEWAKRARALALRPFTGLLDFALPPRCPACGMIVGAPDQFCSDCWGGLDFLDGPACAACSIPLPETAVIALADNPAALLCGACQAKPPPFMGAPAAVAYGPAARTVALRLKYGRRLGHARLMARLMQRPLARLAGDMPMLLVPVPLHRRRIAARGFNQAALIARHLGRLTGTPVALDLVHRTRATPSLRGMNRRQRSEIVRGAFALAPGAKTQFAGRHLVLVDDVHASGATLRACARLLVAAGAARVSALTWARVVPDAMRRTGIDFAQA